MRLTPTTAPLTKRQSQAGAEDPDEEPDAPEDVAAVDPLAGFLAMDPLPRIRWLLRHPAAAPEAAAPLLNVLAAAAAASRAAAEAVARCQELLDAVGQLLGPEYGCGGSALVEVEVEGEGEPEGGAAALRVPALRLVRLLVQASPVAAQAVRDAGLLTAAQAALLRRPPAAGEAPWDALMRLEAMRIWRAAAAQVRAARAPLGWASGRSRRRAARRACVLKRAGGR
jgi:hypothetical protein